MIRRIERIELEPRVGLRQLPRGARRRLVAAVGMAAEADLVLVGSPALWFQIYLILCLFALFMKLVLFYHLQDYEPTTLKNSRMNVALQ